MSEQPWTSGDIGAGWSQTLRGAGALRCGLGEGTGQPWAGYAEQRGLSVRADFQALTEGQP